MIYSAIVMMTLPACYCNL